MVRGCLDDYGTEGDEEAKQKQIEKEEKEEKLQLKRRNFFQRLSESEARNVPDRNQDPLFKCQ